MSVDFQNIPGCVFDLFKEIMSLNPENRGRPRTLTGTQRAHAYGMAWGWDPPLMERGTDSLTAYGLAAYSWHEDRSSKDDVPLRERVLDVLTPQQRKVIEYLWDRKSGASFDAIAEIRGAFSCSPSDEAIKDKIKKIRRRLEKTGLSVFLERSGRRLKLILPQAKKGAK
jgi:hypothetical protein